MELADFDRPEVLSTLFYPRPALPGSCTVPNAHDGTIYIEHDVVLGYRLFLHEPDSPVLLCFHGNGELAADYNDVAPLFGNLADFAPGIQ